MQSVASTLTAPDPWLSRLAWAVRWLLLLVLAFDQIILPWHDHQHDSEQAVSWRAAAQHHAERVTRHAENYAPAPFIAHAALMLRAERVASPESEQAEGDALLGLAAFWRSADEVPVLSRLPIACARTSQPCQRFQALPPGERAPPASTFADSGSVQKTL